MNPSALAMTAYLVARPDPWAAVRAYIAGIFTAYLTVGLVVVFALGDVVDRLVELLTTSSASTVIQGAVGAALVYLALRRRRSRDQRAPIARAAMSSGRAFLLGVTITAAESVTALPYLGALSLLVRQDLGPPELIALLVAYNVVFVTPPVAVAAAVRWSRTDVPALISRVRALHERNTTIRRAGRIACALVGVALVAAAVWDAGEGVEPALG